MAKIKTLDKACLFLALFSLASAVSAAGASKMVVAGTMEEGGFVGSEIFAAASSTPVIASAGMEYRRYSQEDLSNVYIGYGVRCGGVCSFHVGTGTQGLFTRYALTFSKIGNIRMLVAYEDYRDKQEFNAWQAGFVYAFN